MTISAKDVKALRDRTGAGMMDCKKALQESDGDAEAWRELARWATSHTLSSQAAEAYAEVLAILPNDQEANRALGRVWLDGEWIDEADSYRAQGFVELVGYAEAAER